MRSASRDEDAAAARRMRDEAGDMAVERCIHLAIWGLALSILFGVDAAQEWGFFQLSRTVDEGLWIGVLVVAVVASFIYERYHAVSPANMLSNVLRLVWAAVGVGIVMIGFLGGVTALMPPGPHAGALSVLLFIGFMTARAIIGGRTALMLAGLWAAVAFVCFFLTAGAYFLAASAFFGLLFLPGLQGYLAHVLAHRSHISA
jgi:hypothetical protein